MQAVIVLFIRSRENCQSQYKYWFPETLLYRHSGAFEVFARSRSKSYFDRAKVLLGIDRKEDLEAVLKTFDEAQGWFPRWQYESFNPAYLLGFERLATEP